MNKRSHFIIAMVGVILLALAGIFKGETEIDCKRHKAYSVWSKIHPSMQITFDEWNVLRLNNALPR